MIKKMSHNISYDKVLRNSDKRDLADRDNLDKMTMVNRQKMARRKRDYFINGRPTQGDADVYSVTNWPTARGMDHPRLQSGPGDADVYTYFSRQRIPDNWFMNRKTYTKHGPMRPRSFLDNYDVVPEGISIQHDIHQ